MELVKSKKIKLYIYRIFLCLLGSFVLAFGTGVFLTPANVVAGGISGIGIIINHFLGTPDFNVVDIVVWTLNIFFLILSIIFMGKRFTLHTLIATFAYPAFLTLITRTNMFAFISTQFTAPISNDLLLIAGLLGGLCTGAGCALTFLGDGSTGGVDVFCFILTKYTGIKQSFSSFVVDASVIVVGMAIIRNNVVASLIGILSALMAAFTIHFIYVQTNTNYVADIITEKPDEIVHLVAVIFDRTTTVVDAIGSYSKRKKKIVRFVMDKRELVYFREMIMKIDSNAFITIAPAKMVLGEGFLSMRPNMRKTFFQKPVQIKKKTKKKNGHK